MNVDVLAVGAHPDDVELAAGGVIHKLAQRGYAVAILDLTRGELATRGTVDARRQEAEEAARVLGAAQRVNACLPDGRLANTPEQRTVIIPFIRNFRPKLILAPMDNDRHPDHGAAHVLVRDANFYAGLGKIETGQAAYRAPRMYFHRAHGESAPPEMIVDVSAHFEAKLGAIRAYRSQFHNPDYPGEQTYISTPEFWDAIRVRAAYWGRRIGVAYGEPLYAKESIGVGLPPGLEETS